MSIFTLFNILLQYSFILFTINTIFKLVNNNCNVRILKLHHKYCLKI